MKHSDKSITIALCVSLIVHVAVMIGALQTRINELTASLHRPPLASRSAASILISPDSPLILAGTRQSFSAILYTPFGEPASIQPAFSWDISDGGSISANGTFTSDGKAGIFYITVTCISAEGETVTGRTSISTYDGKTPIVTLAPPPSEPFVEPKPPEPAKQLLPPPKPPKVDEDEWGEKDKQGIALSTSPGKTPLSARKGDEDQAFASRDPEGPGPIPDEPSKSLVPPGQGGDGRPPAPDAMANKGTQPDQEVALGNPHPPAMPKPPPMNRTPPGMTFSGASPSVASAEARDILPAPPKTADIAPQPAFENPGQPETAPTARGSQILPIARPNLIGIERPDKNAWPAEVEALTRPPGPADIIGQTQPLPDLAPADNPTAPDIQAAITSLIAPRNEPDPLARRPGDSAPADAPTIVEALLHPAGAVHIDGLRQPLSEIAPADDPGAPDILDAVTALNPPPPQPEQPAEQLDTREQIADAAKPKPPAPSLTPPTPASSSAIGGIPGPPIPAADPAADTGLESDPFAKIPGVEFRDGHVEARSGRQVKTIRPRLSDAARQDVLSLQFPTVIFKVHIDKTGKVTNVNIVRSSGSEAIDMPVYRALWQWWFEPPKDKNGNPMPDVQMVMIHWG